jgi:hypothetical protein
MNICLIRMKYATLRVHLVAFRIDKSDRNFLSGHPYEIMVWAARHDYPEMVREAAPLLLEKPLSEMVTKLPPNIAIPWVRASSYYHSFCFDKPSP